MRNIGVFSGLACTGKSRYLRMCMSWPEFQGATSISIDEVARHHWGARSLLMTKTEKVYRNQVVRDEIQRHVIVGGVQTVLLEMVMLTRKNHQEPFVRMVSETADYLRAIEPERAALEDRSPETGNAGVTCRVALLYCSLDRVKDRLERRRVDPSTNTLIFTMDGILDTAVQFEMPEIYEPLPVNTTDESEAAEQGRMQEIKAFFLKGEKPPQEVIQARMEEARMFLDELKQEAKRKGILEGAAFLKNG